MTDYAQFFPKPSSQFNPTQFLEIGNRETFSEDLAEDIETPSSATINPASHDITAANTDPTMLMESSVEALMEISVASILRHEYPKAIHALSTVLELDPSNSVARANLDRLKNTLIKDPIHKNNG